MSPCLFSATFPEHRSRTGRDIHADDKIRVLCSLVMKQTILEFDECFVYDHVKGVDAYLHIYFFCVTAVNLLLL